MSEEQRQTERVFWDRFEQARPRILGALLDALAGAIRHREQVELPRLPRMADFAVLAEAVGRGLGWSAEAFLDAYELNRDEQNSAALDSSTLYEPLKSMLREQRCFEGTCQALLDRLADEADSKQAKSKGWPKTPRALSGMLRRLTSNLRREGILVEFCRVGHTRQRLVRVAMENACNPPSAPSAPSAELKDMDFPEWDAADGADGEMPDISEGCADDHGDAYEG